MWAVFTVGTQHWGVDAFVFFWAYIPAWWQKERHFLQRKVAQWIPVCGSEMWWQEAATGRTLAERGACWACWQESCGVGTGLLTRLCDSPHAMGRKALSLLVFLAMGKITKNEDISLCHCFHLLFHFVASPTDRHFLWNLRWVLMSSQGTQNYKFAWLVWLT